MDLQMEKKQKKNIERQTKMKQEEIKKIFGDINLKIEEGYDYQVITSVGPKCLYKRKDKKPMCDDEYIVAHENHIVNDYEEEGYEVITVHTSIENNDIKTEILIRKKK